MRVLYGGVRHITGTAHVVGLYVRADKLSPNEAIRKTSLVPAQTLESSVPRMKSKGCLKVGADAEENS